ncbi:MAG: NAD(+)/NADH kinase [Phycisphaerales bacterium]|nr:NAD(+)/NADH kinase [Phycisphaerales bacterium]
MAEKPTILLIADRSRSDVDEVVSELQPDLDRWCGAICELPPGDGPIDAGALSDVDLAVVIGGDGTMIQQARRLIEHDIPLVPINCGRLGFLASFDADSLRDEAQLVFNSDPPRRRHSVLHVDIHRAAGDVLARPAINDCVLTAGPPFRMIQLGLDIGGQGGPTLSGDGLIVSTPTGSTAYNVSAGGPIVSPTMEAVVVTPLAAHSLGFRPFVMSGDSPLDVIIEHANEGTTVVIDGQESVPVAAGDRLRITRHQRSVQFVTCSREPYWRILIDKMRWAAPPSYRRGRPS